MTYLALWIVENASPLNWTAWTIFAVLFAVSALVLMRHSYADEEQHEWETTGEHYFWENGNDDV